MLLSAEMEKRALTKFTVMLFDSQSRQPIRIQSVFIWKRQRSNNDVIKLRIFFTVQGMLLSCTFILFLVDFFPQNNNSTYIKLIKNLTQFSYRFKTLEKMLLCQFTPTWAINAWISQMFQIDTYCRAYCNEHICIAVLILQILTTYKFLYCLKLTIVICTWFFLL